MKNINVASEILPSPFFSLVIMLLCFRRKNTKPKETARSFAEPEQHNDKECKALTLKEGEGGEGNRTRRKLE